MPSFSSLVNSDLYVDFMATWTELGGCCIGLYCSFSLMCYGPPGRVPTPLKEVFLQHLVFGDGVVFFVFSPLSSMESVFHFICGTTGSIVCLDCFACVTLIDSFLCMCTLGVVPIESVGKSWLQPLAPVS